MPVEKSQLTQIIDIALKVVAIVIIVVAICFWLKSRKDIYQDKLKNRKRDGSPSSGSDTNDSSNSRRSNENDVQVVGRNPILGKLNHNFKRGLHFDAYKAQKKAFKFGYGSGSESGAVSSAREEKHPFNGRKSVQIESD